MKRVLHAVFTRNRTETLYELAAMGNSLGRFGEVRRIMKIRSGSPSLARARKARTEQEGTGEPDFREGCLQDGIQNMLGPSCPLVMDTRYLWTWCQFASGDSGSQVVADSLVE